jgi:hypothetical protein
VQGDRELDGEEKEAFLRDANLLKLTEVKHNVDLPADAFRRPVLADEPAKKKAE